MPPRSAGWPAGATTSSRRARSPFSGASSSRRSSGCSGRGRDALPGGPMADTEHGRITDEGIARLRARIGQGFPGRRPWRTEVTRDAIYHLALAIGDLSPLYLDEDYARKTRWGTLIAPPIIVQSMDTLHAVGHSGLPEGLPGVHSIWTGSLYEWERAIKLGDRLRADCYLKSVTEKESTFGGGRAPAPAPCKGPPSPPPPRSPSRRSSASTWWGTSSPRASTTSTPRS